MQTNDLQSQANWEKIGFKTHHGINTPLFSLRTQQSSGIGEYLDLKLLIDWCKKIHFDIIQLLPLNDSGHDPSPYNALSSKALHPIYLSLQALANVAKYPEILKEIENLGVLNKIKRFNYLEILYKKLAILKSYYEKEGSTICSQSSYQNFVSENPWLKPYALFKSLKQKFAWKMWRDWPVNTLPENDPEIHFQIFLQYLCFMQMEEIRQYAEKRGVFLKGDIPILISPDSVDVFSHPELFLQSYSAGAPPDMYNAKGQVWGFPLYNWGEMEKTGFAWWKERLEVSSNLYHLYRLDHIVGFFRIWAFHNGEEMGKFIPENRDEWIPQGEKILRKLLSFSKMLPIGEDLGVVPPEVRLAMNGLGICGTKVMRWERKWNEDKSYIDPKVYSKMSMTTVSTHDSDTLKLWWQNSPEEAKEYARSVGWHYSPNLANDQLEAILKASHHSGSIFHINLLQEYLDLFEEFSWPNLSDERINVPGSVSDRNWSYRYKPLLEEMVNHPKLEMKMKELIA